MTNVVSREEFLQRRRSGLGGSDIGAILGVNKWKTAMQVYLDKVNPEPANDEGMSEAAYWGIELEDLVAKEYQRRTGNKVQRVNAQMVRDDKPWMLANIDRAVVQDGSRARLDKDGKLIGIKGLLECKTASVYASAEWEGESAPLSYVAQVQWYMAVTGADWCDIAVLIGGQNFRIIRVERDNELIQTLTERGELFWTECVQAKVPPQPTTSAEVLQLFPSSTEDSVLATTDVELAISELKQLKTQIEDLEAKAEVCKTEIQIHMADKGQLIDVSGSVLVTWKSAKASSKTNWEAVAKACQPSPDIINQYTKEQAGSRRFLVK